MHVQFLSFMLMLRELASLVADSFLLSSVFSFFIFFSSATKKRSGQLLLSLFWIQERGFETSVYEKDKKYVRNKDNHIHCRIWCQLFYVQIVELYLIFILYEPLSYTPCFEQCGQDRIFLHDSQSPSLSLNQNLPTILKITVHPPTSKHQLTMFSIYSLLQFATLDSASPESMTFA